MKMGCGFNFFSCIICASIARISCVRPRAKAGISTAPLREKKMKPQPIFIGGLGRVFTEIYDLESHRAHRQLPNLQLHEALNLVVLEKGQAEKMRLTGGKIFVITAGMMSEKTAAHDLALRMVGDKKHAIFFVGYAEGSTPGGRLRAAKDGETFVFSPSGGRVTRNCEIQEFDLTSEDDIRKVVSEPFVASAVERFESMRRSLGQAMSGL